MKYAWIMAGLAAMPFLAFAQASTSDTNTTNPDAADTSAGYGANYTDDSSGANQATPADMSDSVTGPQSGTSTATQASYSDESGVPRGGRYFFDPASGTLKPYSENTWGSMYKARWDRPSI